MTYNIFEAKSNFSKLIEKVNHGETVIIAKNGNPVAELVPYKNKLKKRILGSAKGQVVMKPDFDELPEDIIESFYQ